MARLGHSMRNVQWQFPVTFLKRYLKNRFFSFSPHLPPFPLYSNVWTAVIMATTLDHENGGYTLAMEGR